MEEFCWCWCTFFYIYISPGTGLYLMVTNVKPLLIYFFFQIYDKLSWQSINRFRFSLTIKHQHTIQPPTNTVKWWLQQDFHMTLIDTPYFMHRRDSDKPLILWCRVVNDNLLILISELWLTSAERYVDV